MSEAVEFLDAHLNLHWLRPESAVCDAIASSLISKLSIPGPALDLGCGNGLFSFVTWGGAFTEQYDWYRNVDPDRLDIYDAVRQFPAASSIARAPRSGFAIGFDAKETLLAQAASLGLYEQVQQGDANEPLPFADETFRTIFSNMISWLDSLTTALEEIYRVLMNGGRAVLCLPTERFLEYCASYQWAESDSRLLRLLNRQRAESMKWYVQWEDLQPLLRRAGFIVVDRREYWSPLTMRVWDIGLRPLTPVLSRLISGLGEDARSATKREWLDAVRPFAAELVAMDAQSSAPGAYQLVYLERR